MKNENKMFKRVYQVIWLNFKMHLWIAQLNGGNRCRLPIEMAKEFDMDVFSSGYIVKILIWLQWQYGLWYTVAFMRPTSKVMKIRLWFDILFWEVWDFAQLAIFVSTLEALLFKFLYRFSSTTIITDNRVDATWTSSG